MLVSKKKFNEKLEHLIKRVDLYKEVENDYLKRIEEKNGDCQYCMRSLGRIYITVASKEIVVDKDIESFRKNIYVYSKLNLMGTDTRAYLAWKKMNLFCVLMSNNKDFLDFILRTFDIIGHEKEK